MSCDLFTPEFFWRVHETLAVLLTRWSCPGELSSLSTPLSMLFNAAKRLPNFDPPV